MKKDSKGSKKYMDLLINTVAIYAVICAFLYFYQRNLMYFPDTSRPALVQGAEVVDVTTQDGQNINSWYFAPADPSKPTFIYFHGNAGNFGHRYYSVNEYIEAGYGVLLAEYRGYGGNGGKISEEGLYEDARSQINWLLNEKGLKLEEIIIYGESIGTGVAVHIASEFKGVKALVLESPFSSMLEVASKRYFFVPVGLLLKDLYPSIEKITSIKAPLLVMHGHNDRVIPFSLAKKLYEAANQPKKLVDFPEGQHNNLHQLGAYNHVVDFLSGIGANK